MVRIVSRPFKGVLEFHMRLLLLLVLFLLLSLAGGQVCAAPLPVLVSIPPQKYFVERVGGDRVAVTVLVAKNRDPHSCGPTASQMARAHTARLYFAVGVPFERQWLPRIQALAPDMAVVRHSRDGLPAKSKPGAKPDRHDAHAGHDHDHGDDPHIWVSPAMVRLMAPEIRDALCAADPAGAAIYRKNSDAFVAEVDALNARIAALFKPIPDAKRVFLSLHEGWAYYAANFGLHELTVELDGKEPGPKSMAAIIKKAKERKVNTVVVDSSTSKATAAALQENLKARLVRANALEENWPDFLWRFSSALAQSLQQ